MKSEKPRSLTPGELMDGGVLQEANRRFFHPAGLVLTLSVATGRLDVCESPPDALLIDGPARIGKARLFEAREIETAETRVPAVGCIRQQFSGMGPEVVSVDGIDLDDEFRRLLEDTVLGVAQMMPAARENAEAVAQVAAVALRSILRGLRVESRDGGASWRAAAVATTAISADFGAAVVRAGFLVADIRRLQDGGGDATGTSLDVARATAARQLYPHEVEEFDVLAAQVAEIEAAVAERGAEVSTDAETCARLQAVVDDLERLFGNAQRGMRTLRGDPDALVEWERVRPAMQAAAQASFDAMDAADKLFAGQLYDWEDADWPRLSGMVEQRMAAAREAHHEAETEAREAAQELERCNRASLVVGAAMDRIRAQGSDK